jgi:hypothetical protein
MWLKVPARPNCICTSCSAGRPGGCSRGGGYSSDPFHERCRVAPVQSSRRHLWFDSVATMSSIIDAEGNINTRYLTKELQQALEEDVKYKQTDNMKKRAVKVSTDYNEFKAMVACAHLKKLTSKEVESLSHVKKGWQKTAQKDKTGSAVILSKEAQQGDTAEEPIGATKVTNTQQPGTAKPKPKSSMEIERDLRREGSDERRLL